MTLDLSAITPADQAEKRIVRCLLKEGAGAAWRLKNSDDSEALHDFRVAIRRLRTHLNFYRSILGDAASPNIRRELKKITRATAEARDAEAATAWLTQQRRRGPESAQKTCRELIEELNWERARLHRTSLKKLARQFLKIKREMKRKLRTHRKRDATPYVSLAAENITRQRLALRRILASVRTAQAVKSIHRARIEAKKLRYLLEPVSNFFSAGPPAMVGLKNFQTVLGELHDRQLLKQRLLIKGTDFPALAVAFRALEREKINLFGRFKLLHPKLTSQLKRLTAMRSG